MSALETFQFPETGDAVRAVEVGEDVWFVAADVARILGYRMASDMTRRLEPEDRGTRSVRTPSGDQEMTVISEPGLYDAIVGSQVPGARRFRHWVTHDVLPTIRRTGRYETAPAPQVPQTYAQALRAAADADEAREAAEKKAAELEPRAESWDQLASTDGDYLVRDAAKILDRDPRISIGERRLWDHLHHIGWVFRQAGDRRWRPYQRQVDLGRLAERIVSRPTPDGGRQVEVPQVRVTVRGVDALRRRLAGDDQIEGIA